MLIKQIQIPDNSLINSPSFDSVPDHAGIGAVRLTDGIINGWTKKKEELLPAIDQFEKDVEALTNDVLGDYPVALRVGSEAGGWKTYLKNYIKNKKDFFKYEFLIEEEIKIKRYKKNRVKMMHLLNDDNGGIKKRLKVEKERLRDEEVFKLLFPPTSIVLSGAGAADDTESVILVDDLTIDDSLNQINGFTKIMTPDAVFDSTRTLEAAEKRLTAEPIKVPTPGQENIWISSDGASGIYDIIIKETAKELFLQELAQNVQNTINDLGPTSTNVSAECAPQPLVLGLVIQKITPFTANTQNIRMDQIACNGKRIEVVSNYQDLKNMIPWNPPVSLMRTEIKNSGKKAVEYTTNLGEISADNFQIKTFTYRTRGPNDTVKYKKSPPVWACIADKIRDGWEAACNVSGYVPFRIFNGIKGYQNSFINQNLFPKVAAEGTSGYNVYHDGMDIGSWGLSINVDNPVAGYKGNCGQVMSVFTGMWTPKFVESAAAELYDLGVLDYGTGLGDYTDNAYQGFFERERRQAQNWKDAEDAHWTSKLEDTYDKVMKSANGSEIVPPDANPVLWVLTFCERTGMKWGNSFFLRKRYRGARTGNEFIGIEFRDSAPVSWNLQEQNRISAIYGIQDIVARVNAISFPQTSYDAHMHFQYYSGPARIPWDQIETT